MMERSHVETRIWRWEIKLDLEAFINPGVNVLKLSRTLTHRQCLETTEEVIQGKHIRTYQSRSY